MNVISGPIVRLLAVPLLATALWCGASPASAAAAAAPADTQTNPPGDIPDTQAFVAYAVAGGYSVLVPEGWSRTVSGSTATFTAHFNGERIVLRPRGDPAAALRGTSPRMSAPKASPVSPNGARATLLAFTSDSQPDAVTGKRVALEHNAYVFVRGTRMAIVDLWAPQGADNADQWRKISQSFRWK